MPQKRIVLCSDGTWQSSNNGSRAIPSNVAKISRALECWDKDIVQIVYYDTGIGTNVTSSIKTDGEADYSMGEGINGAGLAENVCEAYNFVVNNYTKGDEIYIFGFSRGAYTARAIAGLLAEVGVCSNSMMDQFWEMYIAYKGKKPWQSIKDTEWGQSSKVEPTLKETNGQYWLQKGKGKEWLAACDTPVIQVVGVFDTVGALGWPDGALTANPYWKNSEHGFHNTDIHPSIKNAFHALAIDEHRRPFTPTLWYKPEGSKTNLIQCWFPGVHINIGGGSDDALRELTKQLGDLEGMANVSFAWMVDRVRQFTDLKFNDEALDIVAARYMDNMAQVLKREIQQSVASRSFFEPEHPIIFRGWGVGPMADSFAEQNVALKVSGGSRARAPGRYLFQDNKTDGAPAVQKNTQEYIHPVVAHAWSDPNPAKDSYKASSPDSFLGGALYGFNREQVQGQKGFIYHQKEKISKDKGWIDPAIAKKTTGAEWTSDNYPYWRGEVVLPEFQIPLETEKFKSMERRLITTGPLDQIQVTWTGQIMLQSLKQSDQTSYNEMVKDMTAQNERAKQSLAAWDKANGFTSNL